jgi:ketosteroid isomerase-like protein
MLAKYAEDAVFDVSAVFTDVAPLRGHQNMRRYWDEMWEIWGGLRLDVLEAFDVGEGRYVVDVRLWGKGKRSGVEVDQRFAFLYTFRPEEERIIRAQLVPNVAAALSEAESSASETP